MGRQLTILFLLLSFGSIAQPLGAFHSGSWKGGVGGSFTPSAASYTSVNYSGSVQAWIYKPTGYNDNANNYPLIIFMPGHGEESCHGNWANVNNSGSGIGYFLKSRADETDFTWDDNRFLVAVINIAAGCGGDYGTVQFDDIKTYMTANYRVNTDMVTLTGLSGGGYGIANILPSRMSEISAVVHVAGPDISLTWSSFSGIGLWLHIGTNDATIGRSIGGILYFANGGFSAWNELTPAPRGNYYYNLGHSSSVWNDKVYDLDLAPHNFADFSYKFSKSISEQATHFVEYAESTQDITDYRESREQVALMSAGSPKTNLESRLATLLTTINKSGTRYIVSFQTAGVGSITDTYDTYNIMTSFTTSATLSNITSVTGAASTVDLVVGSQFASTTRDGNTSANNALKMKAFGLNYKANLAGLRLETAISTGYMNIEGIPTGKLVDVIIHHHHEAAQDDGTAFSASSTISTTLNSVTKTQYSAYNSTDYVIYTNIPEVSGSISIYMKPNSTREVLVTSYEILVHD